VNVLTATFAKEFAPKVRVNTVMPGPFHTDATRAWSRSEAFAENAHRFLPLGRAGEPPEIAGAVLYLVSDLASFTTGTCLAVDGGHQIGTRSGVTWQTRDDLRPRRRIAAVLSRNRTNAGQAAAVAIVEQPAEAADDARAEVQAPRILLSARSDPLRRLRNLVPTPPELPTANAFIALTDGPICK
jgi:hypothetical protein